MQTILFATGIECSYPTVAGNRRRDQLAETRHYDYWRRDFELCRDIGAKVVRYGPPYYRMHKGPGSYDWDFTDMVLPVMREMGLIPMVDLCHFGVPDWVGDFQNEDWPALFSQFAGAFAHRYPWITYYTPINEILVCANLSAKAGLWNERLKSDRAMVKALTNQCRACLLAIEAILPHCPEAVFIQSEATEVTLERYPHTRPVVEFFNQLRFITFDFLYGHPPWANVLIYLFDNGMTPETYHWMMDHGRRAGPHCVMGMDYYAHNERIINAQGDIVPQGSILGWHTVASAYYDRYRRPMMLTETNTLGGPGPSGPDWLWKIWHNVEHLRNQGAPVIGYTWFSLQDQVDWDTLLQEFNGNIAEVGLFTLDRQPHPVAAAFKELVERYGDLPLLEEFPVGQMQPTGEPWVVKKKLAAAERGDSGRSGGGKMGEW